ncbi:hypothetical protein [Aulosira sp. FACHB-615]|uniref:hypothetical protein n=1 Tax=Aulosira sp. FACHB-615 TaxID=2692777 RepID=UPI001682FECE|nr:hypothetical protein [Aulosira sp. FACHB-615]MBD2492480.1 hypothetical protein [Aulosira sp. FACHB-615]
MPIKAKQIEKLIDAPITIQNVSVTGSSATVTTPITSALSSAGQGGASVPVQVATSTAIGIVTGSTPIPIRSNTTKEVLTDASGNEIYGKLSSSTGVYTLSFFSLIDGTETSYTFASSQSIDFDFIYRFDFYRLPANFAIARNVYTDPLGGAVGGAALFTEVLTVTALNTINDLTKTPSTNNNVHLIVNGVIVSAIASHFSISGKAITWSANNAGFNLETTDTVVALYTTNE